MIKNIQAKWHTLLSIYKFKLKSPNLLLEVLCMKTVTWRNKLGITKLADNDWNGKFGDLTFFYLTKYKCLQNVNNGLGDHTSMKHILLLPKPRAVSNFNMSSTKACEKD